MAGLTGGASSVEQLLAAKEIVVTCGSGGVGKTTTAAALATMAAVHLGGRVLVLTVDPARRLATAMGLERFGNVEVQVPPATFTAAGLEPRGELWAAMLDTKASWDDLVRRHAPDATTRDAILANPLYQNVTGKFVQSHDYIAMERLYELHASGAYDLIVVDTPPTRNAIDFLEAPERMAEFFSSRLLRWLLAPYRSRFVNAASKPFYQVADRILGSAFLQDIAEFFILFQSMYDGFVERARAVERVLADRRTTFVVVTTLESGPAREAEFFVGALAERRLHLGALVINKVLPSYLLDREATRTAARLCAEPAEVAAAVPEAVGESALVERVLHEIGESFLNFQVAAKREATKRAELAATPEVTTSGPVLRHRHLRPVGPGHGRGADVALSGRRLLVLAALVPSVGVRGVRRGRACPRARRWRFPGGRRCRGAARCGLGPGRRQLRERRRSRRGCHCRGHAGVPSRGVVAGRAARAPGRSRVVRRQLRDRGARCLGPRRALVVPAGAHRGRRRGGRGHRWLHRRQPRGGRRVRHRRRRGRSVGLAAPRRPQAGGRRRPRLRLAGGTLTPVQRYRPNRSNPAALNLGGRGAGSGPSGRCDRCGRRGRSRPCRCRSRLEGWCCACRSTHPRGAGTGGR